MIDNKKLYGFLGLCMKAGKLCIGDGRATDTIRSGNAYLAIISGDASDNTKKKYRNMCEYRDIEILEIFENRNDFGACIGRNFAVIAAVSDEGFARRILELSERID